MAKKEWIRTHDGLNAAVDAAERRTPEGWESSRKNDWGPGLKNWAGATWEKSVTLVRKGWTEGYEAVKRQSQALYGRVCEKIPVREIVYEAVPVNAVLDMGRVMEGDPEPWIEWTETERVTDTPSNKTVHIVFNCSASWNVDKKILFTRGAATVALAEALELAGRSVKITVVNAVTGGWGGESGSRLENWITVKDYDQRANYSVLAFALCHAGMLRRIVFALEESEPQEVRSAIGIPGGYGTPANVKDTGNIYIPAAQGWDPNWLDNDTAEAWILSKLTEQGVSLRD